MVRDNSPPLTRGLNRAMTAQSPVRSCTDKVNAPRRITPAPSPKTRN